ncbi:MAG: helix-turn-helix domain-containing protein [Dysgonomonas sp.]
MTSSFTIYYWNENMAPLFYMLGLCSIAHILFFFVPYKLSYEAIKTLIPVYLVYVSIFLYINVLYFWSFGEITAFLWYSIILLATMVFFKRKTVILWSIYIFILICSAFIVEPFIPVGNYQKPTENQLEILNSATIITTVGFIIFFIFYLNKVSLIKELQSRLNEKDIKTKKEEEKEIKAEKERYEALYNEILNYFSEKKPYCNPEFSIVQLAEDLNSNVKYISRAIRLKENVNFSVFLNIYRINLIKEMIAKDYHNKYTIGYIYLSAGFRHQSTFNKVFKEIEGITPSEYIRGGKIRNDKLID